MTSPSEPSPADPPAPDQLPGSGVEPPEPSPLPKTIKCPGCGAEYDPETDEHHFHDPDVPQDDDLPPIDEPPEEPPPALEDRSGHAFRRNRFRRYLDA